MSGLASIASSSKALSMLTAKGMCWIVLAGSAKATREEHKPIESGIWEIWLFGMYRITRFWRFPTESGRVVIWFIAKSMCDRPVISKTDVTSTS